MVRIGQWAEHGWARGKLSAYVDGALSPRARRRIRRHADRCPDCGPQLRSLTRVVRALRALPDLDRRSVAPGVIARLDAHPVDLGRRRATGGR